MTELYERNVIRYNIFIKEATEEHCFNKRINHGR